MGIFFKRFLFLGCLFFCSLTMIAEQVAQHDSVMKLTENNIIISFEKNIQNSVFSDRIDTSWISKQLNKSNFNRIAKYCKKELKFTKRIEERAHLLLLMSDCYYLAGKEEDAVEGYLQVLTHYRLYVNCEQMILTLYQIALDYRDGHHTFLGFKRPQEAINILLSLHMHIPGHNLAPKMLLNLIKIYMSEEEYSSAIVQVYNMSKKYPLSIESQEAFFLLAKCYYLMALEYDQDGVNAMQAFLLMKDFIAYYPQHRLIEEAKSNMLEMQNLLADYLYKKALFYWKAKYNYQRKPQAARRYLYDLIRQYPEADVVPKAKELIEEIEQYLALQEKFEAGKQQQLKKEDAEKLKTEEKKVKSKNLLPYDKKLSEGKKAASPNDFDITVDAAAKRAFLNQEVLENSQKK